MARGEHPNVWPSGGVFCFSGFDGETRWKEPFVALGRDDGIGWNFCLEPRPRFLVNVGDGRLSATTRREDFVFSDCWLCNVDYEGHTGRITGAFLDWCSMAVRIRFESLPDGEFPSICPIGTSRKIGEHSLFNGDGWWLALVRGERELERQFGIAISYTSEAEAIARAVRAVVADVNQAMTERLKFYEETSCPSTVVDLNRACYFKAVSILKTATRSAEGRFPGRWTVGACVPGQGLSPYDTAFHALAIEHLRSGVGREFLQGAFAGRTDEGDIPLSVSPKGKRAEDGLAHAPLLAYAVSRLADVDSDPDGWRALYVDAAQNAEWFRTHRRSEAGLYAWKLAGQKDAFDRGRESSMGSSPRFRKSTSIESFDLASYMAIEFESLERLARALGREGDALQWADAYSRLCGRANEHHWDYEDCFHYDVDSHGHFIPLKTTAGLLALFAGIADRDQAESVRLHITHAKEFLLPMSLPSVSHDERDYSKEAWRGPVHPSTNYLVYEGLRRYGFYEEATQLGHRTLGELAYIYAQTGCLYSHYDSLSDTLPNALPGTNIYGEAGATADDVTTAAVFVLLTQSLANP